ncbi:MAG: chorismate mutase [Thermoplasmata archaeon]
MTRSGGTTRDEVDRLRGELEAIDRSLILLVGERRRAQHRLLGYKLHHRLALSDPYQEQLVSARARGWATEQHADPDLAEEVVRLNVAAGKRAFFHGATADDTTAATCTVFLDVPSFPPRSPSSSPARIEHLPARAHATT